MYSIGLEQKAIVTQTAETLAKLMVHQYNVVIKNPGICFGTKHEEVIKEPNQQKLFVFFL